MNWDILCISPPIIAIILALKFKQVLPSLMIGILVGLIILHGFSFKIIPLFLDDYLISSISNHDHLYVILFTFLIGGTISIIQFNGGMQGVIRLLSKHINTKKRALTSTYLLGLIIFFDDYANTLIVGNSMRNLTDKHKVSREKLAYIVDSTSAPLASIAFVSTWIGAEIGYIEEALSFATIPNSSYSLFLSSLPYSFYPILTLIFVGIIVYTDRDFGPMAKATPSPSKETNTNNTGSAYLAIVPISILLLVTVFGIYHTGYQSLSIENKTITLQNIIAHSNAYKALLWGAFSSFTFALVLSLVNKKNTFSQLLKYSYKGFSTMFDPIFILILAWILGSIMANLGTAAFISQYISAIIPLEWLPVIIFLLSAFTSFSTGSSWGTMALIYPIALPVVWSTMQLNAIPNSELDFLYMAIAAVLGGAVFGDHCSPISDTTILSSAASQCNHIDHVKTQIPYATLTGITGALLYVLCGFSLSPYLSLPIGILTIVTCHRILSTRR